MANPTADATTPASSLPKHPGTVDFDQSLADHAIAQEAPWRAFQVHTEFSGVPGYDTDLGFPPAHGLDLPYSALNSDFQNTRCSIFPVHPANQAHEDNKTIITDFFEEDGLPFQRSMSRGSSENSPASLATDNSLDCMHSSKSSSVSTPRDQVIKPVQCRFGGCTASFNSSSERSRHYQLALFGSRMAEISKGLVVVTIGART
ncbi:hypothetical protein DM02DRAFT_631458 [Periconia macrospinosa]|uniref:Uncharacterized protein n=1 Tax=Periconia macrospinosa TaxID=97972 RepID=A0A2V1DFZ1_9PLEO|nr:hypothetical protein DM02DRAFT_631458 [Periconia macrospinosa]